MRSHLKLSAAALALAAPAMAETDRAAILDTYADIALAGYEDSLALAIGLKSAVDAFVAAPSDATLEAAKTAWLAARVPYQQTEAFRFGNPTVDDWEGKVNAWPLNEGLIDYIDGDRGMNEENPFATANVIANPTFDVSGASVDATEITPALLESLHEIDGIEANVATGYHAIEFLLWGQDLNGTDHGAGTRPATDFDTASCTGGNCDRRADYLIASTALLASDLEDAVANWSDGGQGRAGPK